MDPHSIVVVSFAQSQREDLGRVARVSTREITMRGIDLNSFDHFIRQLNEPDGERVGVPLFSFR